MSQGNAATRVRCVVESLMISSLRSHGGPLAKNCEHRLKYGEVVGKNIVYVFD